MILGCAWEALIAIVGVLGFAGSFTVFVFTVENGRLPGTRARWRVVVGPSRSYYDRDGGSINVELRKRGSSVGVASLDPQASDFDEQLHQALAAAREKLIALRVSERAARRSLPRS